MVALQCCMSAILTKCKIKDSYFRNFSQSALFPDTKLTAELNNMLRFLNVINYFLGKLICVFQYVNLLAVFFSGAHLLPVR